jgi:hypothetical protein
VLAPRVDYLEERRVKTCGGGQAARRVHLLRGAELSLGRRVCVAGAAGGVVALASAARVWRRCLHVAGRAVARCLLVSARAGTCTSMEEITRLFPVCFGIWATTGSWAALHMIN